MKKKSPREFFEEILSVPRPSGNEKKISEYLVAFAQEYQLSYEVDDFYNVILWKEGNINKEPIILQAHTDMVCTSEEDIHFDEYAIEWVLEDGYYHAKRSSLGADNGAGMAIILSILSENNPEYPPIEAVFTTQEETTMDGAKNLAYSHLKGKRLLSLDGSAEDKIEVSCAGMASLRFTMPYTKVESSKSSYQFSISGMLGGHSGVDIDAHHGNAIKVLAHVLEGVDDIEIVSIDGGSKENVIPSSMKCVFNTSHDLSAEYQFFKRFYSIEYPEIKMDFRRLKQRETAMDVKTSKNILQFLDKIEDGVLKRNDVDFPITSSNLGVVRTKEDEVTVELSIRSSMIGYEDFYIGRAERISKRYKWKMTIEDKKPFFTYRENSPLRQLLVMTYRVLFNKNVTLEDVHAGLEGGIFAHEIPDLDICVIGLNLFDIHSVKEKLEADSLDRVHKWVSKTLEEME